jgi:hypothetical protein
MKIKKSFIDLQQFFKNYLVVGHDHETIKFFCLTK